MSKTSAAILDLAAGVCREIDAARDELLALCARLVAAASVNPPGRTAEAAQVVRDYFAEKGIATETCKRTTRRRTSSHA